MAEDSRILAIADQLAALLRDRLPDEEAAIDEWLQQLLSAESGHLWRELSAGERQLLVLLATSGLRHLAATIAMRESTSG